jgi:hypothetical protein
MAGGAPRPDSHEEPSAGVDLAAQPHAIAKTSLFAQKQHAGTLKCGHDLGDRRKMRADILACRFEAFDYDFRNASHPRKPGLIPTEKRPTCPDL